MIEFWVKAQDGTFYEISELVTKISYEDRLNFGCSKLQFSYLNDNLIIKNGNAVLFKYGSVDIFSGFVFRVEQDKGKEIAVTAYDRLRYCKAKDTFNIKSDTVTTLVTRMCNYFDLPKGAITDTKYVLAPGVADGDPWMDIVYKAISETLVNTGRKYCLRDEFGSVALRDMEDLKLDLVLGDESFCYDYKYDKSIDDDFYNQIKIEVKGNKERESQIIISKDDSSIKKYGLLQYFEKANENSNSSQVKSKANVLLNLYNREAETLSLECLGDTSVRAGSSFYAQISDISLNKRLIVNEVTHEFLPVHTMSLEVSI